MTKTEVAKKQVVEQLIAMNTSGESCCWGEEDRETLNALPLEKLRALKAQADKEVQMAAVVNAAKEGFGTIDPTKIMESAKLHKELVANQTKKDEKVTENKEEKKVENKPLTDQEWLESAPPSIRSAVHNAMRIEAQEKSQLIEKLTANVDEKQRQSHAERLAKRTLDELREDLALMPKKEERVANYFGAGGVAAPESKFDEEDYLPLPTLNYKDVSNERSKVMSN